jgi:nitroreductase
MKMEEMGLFQTIHTARALRRLKPDPVPDEVIAKVIDAAVRAPTGSNLQNWRFVVVKDAARRRQIADLYRASMQIAQNVLSHRKAPPHMTEKLQKQMFDGAIYLAEHFGDVPVLLLAWLHLPPDQDNPNLPPEQAQTYRRLSGASIYGAVQNMILACRALGLGTVLTTVLSYQEAELRKLLNAPSDMQLFAVLPIGYPAQGHGHGPVRRLPISDVTYMETFGNNWPTK